MSDYDEAMKILEEHPDFLEDMQKRLESVHKANKEFVILKEDFVKRSFTYISPAGDLQFVTDGNSYIKSIVISPELAKDTQKLGQTIMSAFNNHSQKIAQELVALNQELFARHELDMEEVDQMMSVINSKHK